MIVLSPASNPRVKELGPGISVEDKKISTEQNSLIIIASDLLGNPDSVHQCLGSLKDHGFLLVRENPNTLLTLDGFNVIVDREINNERILLLRKLSKVSFDCGL